MGTSTSEESFCLRWNDFHSCLISSFAVLREERHLLDVSLVCADGKALSAHKLVLSACSPVFKRMLGSTAAKAKDPVILLYDIGSGEMEALIAFMYHGEVNITQDRY